MPAKKKAVAKKATKKPINQQYSLSVNTELRDAFVKCCKDQDTSAAREVRAFMRRFVAKHGQEKLI